MRTKFPMAVLAGFLAVGIAAAPAHSRQTDIEEEFDGPVAPGWTLHDAVLGDGALWVLDGADAFFGVEVTDFRAEIHIGRESAGTNWVVYRWRAGEGGALVGIGDELHVLIEDRSGVVLDEGARFPIPVGEEVLLTIEVTGDVHVVSVDGAEVIRFTHDGPAPGGFGFISEPGGGMVVHSFRATFVNDSSTTTTAPQTTTTAPVTTPPPEPDDPVWVRTGGPLGGLGYDVRMRPDDPDVMLVSDGWAGMFMSEDAGATWFPVNDGITVRSGPTGEAIPVFSATIDPHDPDIVWAGTQYLRGIFKSTDGGRTWAQMDRGVVENEGISFRGFAVDPRTSDIVYAAAEISSWVWAGEERPGVGFDMTAGIVYQTVDGGQNWSPVWRGDNLARYVWIDPTDPDILYVSTGIFDREAANSDPAEHSAGGVGVIKSTDGGATWTEVNEGLEGLYVGSLFMHPEEPQILLAGVGHNTYPSGSGVYRSDDGAATWTKVLDPWEAEPAQFHSVEFAMSDPNVAYAASDRGVWRSNDAGVTWRRQNAAEHWGPPAIRVGFPIDLQVDPRDPDRLFINAYGGGNFISIDAGRTWQAASTGYTGAQIRGVVVDPQHPGRVWAAGRSGLFESHDGGATWTGVSPLEGWPTFECFALEVAQNGHLLESDTADRYIASGFDTEWTATRPAVPDRQAARALAFAPSNPRIAYAGIGGFFTPSYFDDNRPGSGIFRSTDGGDTWLPVNDGLTEDAHVASVAVHPEDSDLVFAATTDRGLLRTDDGGESWADVGGLAEIVSAVRIHPADPSVVLAGSRGIFRSADGGATWSRSRGGPAPESYVTDFAFDPTDRQVIYAADLASGVYRSSDGGVSWTGVNDGLRARAVWAIDISSDARHLYAGTEGEGVWRLDLAGTPPPTYQPERPVTTTTSTPKPPDPSTATTTSVPTPAVSTTISAAQAAGEDGGSTPWLAVAVGGGLVAIAMSGWVIARARRG